jgi:phosphoesterase RecJ-like protein
MLALDDILRRTGKSTGLYVASKFPPRYGFLDEDRRVTRFEPESPPAERPDAVVVLDTGTWNQLGDFGPYLRSLSVPKVVIDHHPTQDDLGALPLVDVSAEATGRLTFEAIRALGTPLSARAAECLFVALAMDTGWFRHANVKVASFSLAAELVGAGARPELLYHHLYEEDSLPKLKLTGLILDRLRVTNGGRVAYTELYRSDYESTDATPQDTEDLVNYTRSLVGVEVGLFFMEQPKGGVKVSFRSRGADVGRVAERFGGGGHRLASGAIVDGPLEQVRARVLDAVGAALGGPR